MVLRPGRFWRVVSRLAEGLFLTLLVASAARADDDLGPEAYSAKVAPAIIHVKHERALGGGFIIDAEKGIVVTSYRAIEGARKVAVFFPADKERKKKEFPADGYYAILPGKDLALIHVNFGDRKVAALKLAEKTPEAGARVFTFAMPPHEYFVSMGILTDVWTGKEASNLLDKSEKGMYEKAMGYDLDAHWFYHSSTVFLRLGGEPLLNYEGEVTGMNMLRHYPADTNMTLAISVKHIRDLMATAGKELKTWSTLPRPRRDRALDGDARKNNVSEKRKTNETERGVEEDNGPSGFRVWTSSNGNFHLRAKYVGRDGDDVKLKKPDGHVIRVPFSKLSKADRRFVEEKEEEDEKGDDRN
jgi:hypothetical protein